MIHELWSSSLLAAWKLPDRDKSSCWVFINICFCFNRKLRRVNFPLRLFHSSSFHLQTMGLSMWFITNTNCNMRKSSRSICYQFQDKGYCTYGTSCKFSHPVGSRPGSSKGVGDRQRWMCLRLFVLKCTRSNHIFPSPINAKQSGTRTQSRLSSQSIQTSITTIREAWRKSFIACATSLLGTRMMSNAKKLVEHSETPWSSSSTACMVPTSPISRTGTSFA